MTEASATRPYFRFAGVSMVIVALLATAAAALGLRWALQTEEHTAAASARDLVASPLARIFADQADPRQLTQRADAVVQPLLDGNLEGVRVLDASGSPVYVTGAFRSFPAPDAARRLSWDRADGESGGIFVTSTNTNGIVVQIAQDSAPVNAAVSAAQWTMILGTVAFAAAMWCLLQSAFWLGVRPLTNAHARLAYLYDTGQQLRSSLDLHDVLTRLAADATSRGGGHQGLVALYDEPTTELMLRTTYDRELNVVAHHQRAVDEWFMRRAVVTNATISAQSAGQFAQYFGPQTTVGRNACVLCVPMAVRDRVLGVIAVVGPAESKGFSPAHIKLVEELASQAVTAVEQALLFAKVRADATELESSYDSTLKALMAALDAKDEVTEGHCERVARMTVQLARAMGIPDTMIVHVERGALLHDVGKIGVPDGILKKPKQLNEGEWEAMRKHPLLAGLMVSKVGFLEPALPILLYHHERYDGGGYPFGLAAEHIPVEARIFSIVDAYDAMTSDRPYRPALTHEQAMAEVRANSGSQFDPIVVTAFDQLMAERPELHARAGQRLDDHDDDHEPLVA